MCSRPLEESNRSAADDAHDLVRMDDDGLADRETASLTVTPYRYSSSRRRFSALTVCTAAQTSTHQPVTL